MGLITEATAEERAEYYEGELTMLLRRVKTEAAEGDGVDQTARVEFAQLALKAGLAAIELGAAVAMDELKRKVIHIAEAEKIKAGGVSETKSLELARVAAPYIEHCSELVIKRAAQQMAELVRDVALAIGRAE